MQQYLETLKDVLHNGDMKTDRTGTGTRSKFGGMMKYDLRNGKWPVVTTRKIAHEKIAQELEWMLKGIISVDWLQDRDNKIWNSWMGPETGTIGPMYGEQWRNWNAGGQALTEADYAEIERRVTAAVSNSRGDDVAVDVAGSAARTVIEGFMKERNKSFEKGGRGGVDQLQYVINELKNNPDSRRIVVNVWHAGLLPDLSMTPAQNADAGRMALAPCHSMWQVCTSAMTEHQILRHVMERDESFVYDVFDAPSEKDSHQHHMLYANHHLIRHGYMQMKEGRSSIQIDDRVELTEAGKILVEEHIAKGRPTRKISLTCYARSQDLPLGTSFNVGMYSLLTHVLGALTNMVPWEYTHFMGDYHIYHDQVECVKKQLERLPKKMPRVLVDPTMTSIEDFKAENLQVWYDSHEAIRYPMAAV